MRQDNLFHAPLLEGATFSPRRVYRYSLTRYWGGGPRVLWILLNPSTADEFADDPTLRRAIGFSKAWGYGGLVFCNLFAYRATDPRAMKSEQDPVGLCNDMVLVRQASRANRVVLAWGTHGAHMNRDQAVLDLLRDPEEMGGTAPDLWCLGTTKDGHPKHPLYLAKSTALEPFLPVVVSA